MPRFLLFLLLPLLPLLPLLLAAPAAPAHTAPLNATLDGCEYPFPVHYLSLKLESQHLRMAYMDVPPTSKSNGRTAAQIKGAKRVETPTVGHIPHLEVSAQFYKALLAFLG